MTDHTKEQERIKNQSVEEWTAEYFGEPVKELEPVSSGATDDNFGVEF